METGWSAADGSTLSRATTGYTEARSLGPASRSHVSSALSACRDRSSSFRPDQAQASQTVGAQTAASRAELTPAAPGLDQPAVSSGFREPVHAQAAPRSRRSPSRSSIV